MLKHINEYGKMQKAFSKLQKDAEKIVAAVEKTIDDPNIDNQLIVSELIKQFRGYYS